KNIKRFRLRSLLTQSDLASLSGLSQGYLNQLESGKRNYTQKSLEIVSRALGIPIIEFFRGSGRPLLPDGGGKSGYLRRGRTLRRECLDVLEELPFPIVEHYLALLKMEKSLLDKEDIAEEESKHADSALGRSAGR
ncbi:MAG: helix-turn-helix transcriptional regulator, partial [Nitrospirales bacterium]|nr:helix-turn-helix transcriptional regulator [Nitrospirales bacterium]